MRNEHENHGYWWAGPSTRLRTGTHRITGTREDPARQHSRQLGAGGEDAKGRGILTRETRAKGGAATDRAGNSYFYSYGWTYMHRITNGRLVAEALPTGYKETNLQTDNEGRMWLFVDGHWNMYEPLLYRVSGGVAAEEFDLTETMDGNIWIYDLAFDRNNNAWVATNKGVVVYNGEGVRF